MRYHSDAGGCPYSGLAPLVDAAIRADPAVHRGHAVRQTLMVGAALSRGFDRIGRFCICGLIVIATRGGIGVV